MAVSREDLRLVREVLAHFFPEGRNYADRDDAVSDGMLALAQADQIWEERPDIRARFERREQFLKSVIKHRVIDGFRKRNGHHQDGYRKQRFEQRMYRLDEVADDQQFDHQISLAERVGSEDPALADVGVLETLDMLPSREREIVVRTVIDGEGDEALADDFGVSSSRISQLRTRALEQLRTGGSSRPSPPPARAFLSDREREVLQAMADGFRNDEIASNLTISGETVKAHVKHILSKMGARSRTHAVAQAFRSGLVT